MIYLVICSLLNVVLDLLFIVSFGMGVEGAAWATVISQACFFFAAVRPLHSPLRSDCPDPPGLETGQNLCEKAHRHGYSHGIAVLTITGHRFHRAAGVGQSAGLQLCGQRGGGNQKSASCFCCTFDALGSTMATYGGQNVGAGRLERIGKGLKSCSVIGIVYSLAAFGVLSAFGGNLSQMFMDAKETLVIANSALFLTVNSAAYIPLAFVNIVRFFDSGTGLYPAGRVRRCGWK